MNMKHPPSGFAAPPSAARGWRTQRPGKARSAAALVTSLPSSADAAFNELWLACGATED